MKIAIAADHAGYTLKERIREVLTSKGHEVQDFGTTNEESTDYPDFALPVARAVSDGAAERGVLICHTGVGMSMAANKVAGVRAALGVNEEEVRLTRAHNNANILTLGASYTSPALAGKLVDIFLSTEFEGGRHARRVAKIAAIESSRGKEQGSGKGQDNG